jgi:hypothetical protein
MTSIPANKGIRIRENIAKTKSHGATEIGLRIKAVVSKAAPRFHLSPRRAKQSNTRTADSGRLL